ncbi:hypothetical protein GH714_002601 [Hevea brasiliensis]|uniref:peroxidase n=1 Tax=Hevea brasiliensis TaxID=3981 RepID=A0A6A6LBS9_HEVBR|nr:hypothetical protein GH714_002601 [Hevea brasiliensis]
MEKMKSWIRISFAGRYSVITGEGTAGNNANSIRGFKVIDDAKAQVESICPGIVSCADILAVAARDASVAVGGPSWTVNLERRDSTTASRSLADSDLPAFTDSLDWLICLLGNKDLNARDMVALSDGNYAPLDLVTPNTFDNGFYSNLIARRGLLQSDQVLFSGGSTDSIVNEYSTDSSSFSSDFASAMVKMGNIDPLTRSQREIRRVCTAVN